MEVAQPYPRHAIHAVREALTDTPVVVIQGARQVGKSTLASLVASDHTNVRSVTLDDPVVLAFAESDPVGFVAQAGAGLIVIDEAQRAPGLILPLKANVDRDRAAGRFLLTGSADLLQIKGVGDSLAGRAETVELMPLSQGELARRPTPEDFVAWALEGATGGGFTRTDPRTIVAGGYPEAVRRSPARASRWFSDYVNRLADHDARELQQGGYADHMGTLLELVASGGQAELVKAKLARSMGVTENTVDAYVRLATTMRLVTALPSWGRSPRGRISRRPKVALNDTGLAAHLSHFSAGLADHTGGREHLGALTEQFVALELRKQAGWSTTPYSLYHYRHHDGPEVDIVAELDDGRLVAIEVKSSQTVTAATWAGLDRFRSQFRDRDVIGVVLHGGTDVGHLHGWLHILPLASLWQHAG